MTIYVDPLADFGWILRGRRTPSCHMFTDSTDLAELHELARKIGLKRQWFQATSLPHYDLTPSRRAAAVEAGALEVDRHRAVLMWQAWRKPKTEKEEDG